MNTPADMPLVERLRKAADCVIFLDGAPEPVADVSDMLRKAADEIERLRRLVDLAADELDKILGMTKPRETKDGK